MSESVGFIGIGIMGQGMVRNLAKAGLKPLLWNRTRSRLDDLVAEGFEVAESPAAVAAASDVVITCVSDTPDVEAVVLGEQGVLEGVRAGSLVIDMSTISPRATEEIGKHLAERDVHMLDAPISGGSEGAAKGTLSIMVGGEAGDVERAMPFFEAMGKAITHVGPLGSGQKVKLVNQILVVVNALAVSEALVFAQAGGLDLEKTLQAVIPGAAGSWMLANRGPQVVRAGLASRLHHRPAAEGPAAGDGGCRRARRSRRGDQPRLQPLPHAPGGGPRGRGQPRSREGPRTPERHRGRTGEDELSLGQRCRLPEPRTLASF